MYLKPERTEWIGISIGRWLLVWLCVPVLILFVGLLFLQIDIERKTNLLQTEVMRSMMDLVNTNNKEITGLRKDLRATQDEILVWYTKTNGEQKKGNKK